MTFEGDATGLAVAAALFASPARERRVLVDGYTRVNINDRNLATARSRRDAGLQAEVRETAAMFRDLVAAGVPVRVTNPVSPSGLNYPCRNHKKLILADDVAYVGGVNFSDHNFDWPDMMLRIDDRTAVDFLAGDFDGTWCGASKSTSVDLGEIVLIALDGRNNALGFAKVFQCIDAAKQEIVVASPYLTAPFVDLLGRAARRGVAVRLLTPWANNKPIVREALLWSAARHGFEIVLGPVMSHLKGMLVDGRHLIVGSSNFDFASLAAEEEFLAIVDYPSIVDDFRTRVIAPAIAAAIEHPAGIGRPRGRAADLALRFAALAASAARGFRRSAVDWPG